MTISEKYSSLLADVSAIIEAKVKGNGGVLSLYSGGEDDLYEFPRVGVHNKYGQIDEYAVIKLLAVGERIEVKCVGIGETGDEECVLCMYELLGEEKIDLAIYLESL